MPAIAQATDRSFAYALRHVDVRSVRPLLRAARHDLTTPSLPDLFSYGRMVVTGSLAHIFWATGARAKASPTWRYHEVDTNHMVANNRPVELAAILFDLTA
jgi:hypothetical protein